MNWNRIRSSHAAATAALVCAVTVAACGGDGMGSSSGSSGTSGSSTSMSSPAAASGSAFTDTALVVDKAEVVASVATIDANLKNPWGIAVAPGLPFWIADNASNLTTLYSGTGTVETQGVTGSADTGVAIPASAAGDQANPTGQVYNGGGGFLISTPKGQETALFIFDGEGGLISAWAQDSGATAVTAYDDGAVNGSDHAVYKGLALATVNGATYLYATDLHNNKVDVFDTNFSKPAAMQGKFIDPKLPTGYAPFGIASLKGQLYVTFAKQDSAMQGEILGAGLGYVDVFDFSGNLVNQFASAGVLNAPWGLAIAPAGFGSFEGDVLVGNFGDGSINIFAPNGTALATSKGALMDSSGKALNFAGLWALAFGNGDSDKPVTTLFYTAGFADQTDGVFGSITFGSTAATPPPTAPTPTPPTGGGGY
jgi:uncharacterized protein (TIGR03118 family)